MGESSYEADCPSPFGTTAKCMELNMAGCCHSNSVMGVLTYNGCDSFKKALTEQISMIRLCFHSQMLRFLNRYLNSDEHLFKEMKVFTKIQLAQLGWLLPCLGAK